MKKILTFIIALTAMLVLCTLSVFAAEAKIGETEYPTIEEAFEAVQTGDTITVIADAEVTALLRVKDGYDFTLDLNGKTLTAGEERYFIISVEAGGRLVINDGDNTTNTGCIYNPHNYVDNGEGGYALYNAGTLIVNGGTFIGDYAFYNGAYTNTATAILNGGVFKTNAPEPTVYYSIANNSNLTIAGATVENWLNTSGNFTMTSGSVENFVAGDPDKTPATGVSTSIQGGTIATLYVGETNTVDVSDDVTIESIDGSAKIGNTYYYYLQDAIDATQNGETITILCDIELDSSITVPQDSNAVIDLAGYTISYTSDVVGESMITNKGTLVIDDSSDDKTGTISYTYIGELDSDYSKGNYGINNYKNLTINNGNIVISAGDGYEKDVSISHAFYAIQNGNGSYFTINNGSVYNVHGFAVRLFGAGNISVNGGEIVGTRAIWIQLPSTNTSVAPEINVSITGGTLTATYTDSSDNKLAIYSYSYGNSMKNVIINISGGTFNGDVALTGGRSGAKVDMETVTVTGGTFNGVWGDLYTYAADEMGVECITILNGTFSSDYAALYSTNDGTEFVDNGDGSYGVKVSDIEIAFTFLGYSVNENDLTSITAGYTVDQELLALYCEHNDVTNFDFGCSFGINAVNEKHSISFKDYSDYQTFNVKIVGINSTNTDHINANLAMAMYINIGEGKKYVVSVDGQIQIVEASNVPTVTFKSYIPAE